MKKSLLILFTLFISVTGYSQTVGDTFIDNFITYEVTSITPDTVEAIDYDMAGGAVVDIPEFVPFSASNFAVTSVANLAFSANGLVSVTIPNSVTYIGYIAFGNNNSTLTDIISLATTPATIQTGQNDTFGNRSIKNLTIPSGTSAAYASGGWTGFNSVTELLTTGDTFVQGFITYEVTSSTANTVQAIDYDMAGGTVVDIPTSVSFGVSNYDVTGIGVAAFQSKQLTSVTIPNSITNIEHHAFNNNQLTSLILPESITDIGYLGFSNNNLNTIISLNTIPPTINTSTNLDTFSAYNRNNINLILTGNTTDDYVTDSGAQWTGFKMVFEATSATEIKVTDYDAANGTAVTIPASISIPSVTVFDVTEIGDSAFANKGLTDVTIGDNVTIIGTSAFETNNLTNVTIPDSVVNIGFTAFSTNTLTNVVIGVNVAQIGVGAFVDNNLTDITIPSNVTLIGLLAFGNNPSLANVTSLAMVPPTITTGTNDTFIFDRSNTALNIPTGTTDIYVTNPSAGADWSGFNPVTEVGSLAVGDTFVEDFITYEVTSLTPDTVSAIDYDMAGGTVVDIPATVPNTSFSVTEIGFEAFNEKAITSVSIPNSVTSIGNRAFRNNFLSTVTIPDSVTIINNEIFVNNELTSVALGNNVTSIGTAAFQDNDLTNIALPNTLTNIANQAFFNNNLSSITLPDGLTYLGGNVFYNNNLTSIVLPDGLTTIYGNCFRNNQLTSVTFGNNITTIGTDSFSFNNLTSVTFGDNVTSISSSAFRNNQLTNIYIPSNITNINWRAFINNPLVTVTSESVVPPNVFTGGTDDDSFGNRSGVDLIIPTGTTDIYVTNPTTAADWSGFNTVTEDAALSTSNFELNNDVKVITTKDAIKVMASNSIRLENYTIYSITGAKIATGTESEISTAAFANGIYILKLEFDRGTLTKKVIVD